MSKSNVVDLKKPAFSDAVTELLREGAQRLISEAIESELESFLEEVREKLSNGKERIVRNGYLPERPLLTGIGEIRVKVPRTRDRLASAQAGIHFESNLVPRYLRRVASVNEALPLLYLKGLSEKDFQTALIPLFGEAAKNLSPGVISRLKMSWEGEYQAWRKRTLTGKRYVYWWADGIELSVRNEVGHRVLVILGVTAEGKKELVALEDGFRESTASWLSVLRDLKEAGIESPALAVGDGALGFWAALRQVFPETRHQRCWFHKLGNVLDKLPKSQQAKAKSMLHEIFQSATKTEAMNAFDLFMNTFKLKYAKAVECLEKDRETLLTFYDFPAEHWIHLRTTNPIESTFSIVRHRSYKAKGAFSEKTILTMVFKIFQSAEERWIRIRGFEQLNNVIIGIKFRDGLAVLNETDSLLTEKNNQEAA
jgi:transposase-like protein